MEKLTSPKPSELIRYVPKYTLIHYITYAETFFMRISITDLASLARSIFIINVPTYAYIKIRILYIYTGLRIRIRCFCMDPIFKFLWIRIRFVLRGWIRIRFVLRGWIQIRSISDRIRNPA